MSAKGIFSDQWLKKMFDNKKDERHIDYNYEHLPPVAMANKVPGFGFTLEWAVLVVIQLLRITLNKIAIDLDESVDDLAEQLHEIACMEDGTIATYKKLWKLSSLAFEIENRGGDKLVSGDLVDMVRGVRNSGNDGDDDLAGGLENLFQFVKDLSRSAKEHDLNTIQDYMDLFKTIPLPAIANNFREDQSFAAMRVMGPNPLVITRLTEPLVKFPLTDAMYRQAMGDGDNLADALAQGRVYVADYEVLNGALLGTFPSWQKYMAAPIAMFAVPPAGSADRRLVPVAIQLGQVPGTDTPLLVRPEAGAGAAVQRDWQMAKTFVDVADGNYHEAISHLGQTHLVMEAFTIASYNTFSEDHPINQLLNPHFEGTLFINNLAQKSLIAAGGTIDKIMAGTIDQSRIYGARGAQSFTFQFNQMYLPRWLARRGVADTEALPVYPYRDCALLVFDAVKQWCESYVDAVYSSDTAVLNDDELQAWRDQLASFEGGRMGDIGIDGNIPTRACLSELLTTAVFTASAQHAAVNFPQSTIMSFAPAMPLAAYTPTPGSADFAPGTRYVDMMPPFANAIEQLNVGILLGSVYYTQLGEYPPNHFDNPQINAALATFQQRLAEVERQIEVLDPDGEYPYLRPSQIPQSINI